MVVDIFNTDKKYGIIYVDPPWEYRESGSDKGARGLAKQHYKTMSLDDICSLPIEKIKTDVAVCFMWATFPKIAYALKVLEAWGFTYKTAAFVWIKQNKKSSSLFCPLTNTHDIVYCFAPQYIPLLNPTGSAHPFPLHLKHSTLDTVPKTAKTSTPKSFSFS